MTEDSLPLSFRNQFGIISVHGLLAAFLTFGNGKDLSRYSAWCATWPSIGDFQKSMPLLWPQDLRTWRHVRSDNISRGYYPITPAIGGLWASISTWSNQGPDAKGLLQLQEEKLKKDWDAVLQVYCDADQESYTYNWLVVNTRSFYYELPRLKEPRARADRMALCPFIDYFNHADQGVSYIRSTFYTRTKNQCNVTFDEKGFTVTSDRDYGISTLHWLYWKLY